MTSNEVETCNCRKCQAKKIKEMKIEGNNPVQDFLEILARVAKKPTDKVCRAEAVGDDDHEW